ncbi:hypothetical protein EHF33_20485 (plasmid) [Deinococcus psychrotolerans]|uniref:Uncharacterized protein n=1 Tax=Deinococcus psychrotolerans TaxID=2489213 RepID=A0A3G8YJ53_9DEIO|nr:hypothetical protein [Deinococcus psychrotolerans]AZI45289.1 hypothetical protein EHF33_20485 [Deinococcus psychrotolerans]
MNESKRGSWRMGLGALLAFIGMNGLANGSLLGLALLLIAVALFRWGAQRAFVVPSLPRVATVLERAARELRS